ncbi:signal peptidase II [Leptolyngbya sp. FACHB-17]|uniref:signal peptidase II n=1 Tax=unclassified Leptolyngbya TaxID=2650499 RepID=UPI001680B78B|nr:signal peptidase II [Leptolyngbya sp. FACHB-17]MBD2080534.1 lipoprotein signal peptidase [Leptolyngbya sp. FACHB-17]
MLKNRFFWIVAIAGLIIDRLTKLIVVRTMALTIPPQDIPVIPGILHWVYVINDGAAFGILSGSPILRWLSLLASVALMAWAWFGRRMLRWEQIGYGLILSGALGNGIDRFVLGHVVDFIKVPFVYVPYPNPFPRFIWIQFPIFNFADIFINVGIICLLIGIYRTPDPQKHPN